MTTSVTATDLPSHSCLHAFAVPGDFLDCYSVRSDMSARQAAELITQFPGWARFLMLIRKAVTAPFGLTNDAVAADKVGIFPVESQSDNELIAGFNDKHLNFRISVMSDAGRVTLATWVHPHNLGGRLYLKAIMPFHILISRDALKRVGAEPFGAIPA